jgi:hypothetical protein
MPPEIGLAFNLNGRHLRDGPNGIQVKGACPAIQPASWTSVKNYVEGKLNLGTLSRDEVYLNYLPTTTILTTVIDVLSLHVLHRVAKCNSFTADELVGRVYHHLTGR